MAAPTPRAHGPVDLSQSRDPRAFPVGDPPQVLAEILASLSRRAASLAAREAGFR